MDTEVIRANALMWLSAIEAIYQESLDELDELCVAEAWATRTDPTIGPLMIAATDLLQVHAELRRRLQPLRQRRGSEAFSPR